MVIRLLFLVLAGSGLLAALGVVLARNLVRAALYLVAFFFVVACLYLLLEVDLLAAIQVLVYIGAVAILLLFGIMLTRNIQGDETTTPRPLTRVLGGLAALGLLVALCVGIAGQRGLGDRRPWTEPGRPALAAGVDAGQAAVDPAMLFGVELMTRFVVAFELAGLLLTAAVVGAIALAMEEPEPDAAAAAARRASPLARSSPPTPEAPSAVAAASPRP